MESLQELFDKLGIGTKFTSGETVGFGMEGVDWGYVTEGELDKEIEGDDSQRFGSRGFHLRRYPEGQIPQTPVEFEKGGIKYGFSYAKMREGQIVVLTRITETDRNPYSHWYTVPQLTKKIGLRGQTDNNGGTCVH